MSNDGNKATIGFIGLGIMGRSMAGHILEAGYPLRVYNRTAAKADDLVARGAVLAKTPGELATACDVVITIVGYPADVEGLYFGEEGLIARARAGALLIDMTTSSPELSRRIAEEAAKRAINALDAPVSGGDVGTKAGKLAIMVGGAPAAFEQALPVFKTMGERIALMGEAGAGQHTKMANQIAIAATMLAVSESLAYAETAGLDLAKVIEVVGSGAASSFLLNGLGPKMAARDYAPGFFVHHFVKDMGIALSEAERMGLDLPGLGLAGRLYHRLVDEGYGEEGTQALYRIYDARAGATGAN